MPRGDPYDMASIRACQDHRVCRRAKDCLAARQCYFVHAMERHLELHPEDDPMLQPMTRQPLRPLFVMPPNARVVCCESEDGICAPDCVLHTRSLEPELEDNVIWIEWIDELEEEPA